jgi:N6-L-threonylcarbamoyladenine synthase
MKILGIETSCDETAASVVEDGTRILSNIVASSVKMHATTGGIIPENAAREQVKSIIPVIASTMQKAKCSMQDIDSIAVTTGPGLVGSLLVGVETAKTLAYVWDKPIIPVNHLVGHIYANWLTDKQMDQKTGEPKFPALALVVSGGHTDLVLMKGHGKLKWIGGTRDDAAGEAFDKCARLLGLAYPGGPHLSAEAERCLKLKAKSLKLDLFPRPLINEDTLDFSFSGLKTAVMRKVTQKPSALSIQRLAAEIQEAIVDVLVDKTLKAVEKYKPKSFLVSGGVAANARLRERLQQTINSKQPTVKLLIPKPKLCTDNAAATASAAYFNQKVTPWNKLTADPGLTITSQINPKL